MPRGRSFEIEMPIGASPDMAKYATIYYFLCSLLQKFALSSGIRACGRKYPHLPVPPIFYLFKSYCEDLWVAPCDLDKD